MSTPAPAIDLSQLPPPDVVRQIDYEAIRREIIAVLEGRITDYIASEADPLYVLIEIFANDKMFARQQFNDEARQVMLPYATGTNLDNLAALLDVRRQIVTPAGPTAIPPVAAVYETDERLRRRTQLAPSAVSTAGPVSSYRFHALSADARVLDVAVASPAAGSITVTVLSREGNGTAAQALLDAVTAALNAEDVRPLGDVLAVQSATIVEYQVTAELTIGSGPDSATVLAAAREAVAAMVAAARRIGIAVPLSAIYAALHVAGVTAVSLTSPAADVAVGAAEASYAAAVTITAA